MSPEEATSGYRKIVCGSFILHCFETLSGLRFIINTDRSCDNLQDTLRHLYANIFIDTVAKNPLYRYQIGENIVCPLFEEQLHEYFSLLPGFSWWESLIYNLNYYVLRFYNLEKLVLCVLWSFYSCKQNCIIFNFLIKVTTSPREFIFIWIFYLLLFSTEEFKIILNFICFIWLVIYFLVTITILINIF